MLLSGVKIHPAISEVSPVLLPYSFIASISPVYSIFIRNAFLVLICKLETTIRLSIQTQICGKTNLCQNKLKL
jgi:hypothetical protein